MDQPDLIRARDATSLTSLEPKGRGTREMFDRRTGAFESYFAYLYEATFGESVTVEVQVNPEFSEIRAERHATRYATAIGRLPAFLFRDLDAVWIHDGDEPYGGGNRSILIHTDWLVEEEFLEEVLCHEGAHTSMDAHHAGASGWLEAQQRDRVFISDYARVFSLREDVAESLP